MLKRLLKSEFGLRAAGTLAGLLVRLVIATTRWERVEHPEAAALLAADRPVIGAFWHNRLMLIGVAWPKGKPLAMVQSEHGDSRMLGIALAGHFTRSIWGSSRHNPATALRGMLRALAEGISIGITPDGPRGPRMRCRAGIVQVARRTGVPVVPVAWSVSRRRLARSWDRFVIAWPCGRGVIVLGAPIRVPADADDAAVEESRRLIETALTEVADEADRRVGQPPIQPAAEREPAR